MSIVKKTTYRLRANWTYLRRLKETDKAFRQYLKDADEIDGVAKKKIIDREIIILAIIAYLSLL